MLRHRQVIFRQYHRLFASILVIRDTMHLNLWRQTFSLNLLLLVLNPLSVVFGSMFSNSSDKSLNGFPLMPGFELMTSEVCFLNFFCKYKCKRTITTTLLRFKTGTKVESNLVEVETCSRTSFILNVHYCLMII